jgi:hypothetical protein
LIDNSASVPHSLQIPIELTILASCGLNSEAPYHIAIWTIKPNAEYSKSCECLFPWPGLEMIDQHYRAICARN